MDRLENFMTFLDDRNLVAIVIMSPRTNRIQISVHDQTSAPVLFSGEGKTVNEALDDLIGSFQKVGYI